MCLSSIVWLIIELMMVGGVVAMGTLWLLWWVECDPDKYREPGGK